MPFNPTNANRWRSNNRTFYARLVRTFTSGGQTYTYEYKDGDTNTLASFQLERNLVSAKNLTFGNTCSSKLEITLKNVTNQYGNALSKGNDVVLYISPTGTSLGEMSLGRFYIDEKKTVELRTTSTVGSTTYYNNDITLVCYDAMCKMEVKYTPSFVIDSDHKRTLQEMAIDVLTCAGFTSSNLDENNPFSSTLKIQTLPENPSCRDMLGWLAGYEGNNCIVGARGDIVLFQSKALSTTPNSSTGDTTMKIGHSEQYIDEYVKGGGAVQINRVESGTAANIYVYPENGTIGHSVSFENPWITSQSRVQAIRNKIQTFARTFQGSAATYLTYYPMSVRWRGYPELAPGDFISVEDRRGATQYCCIMRIVDSYDGGFSEEIECYGEAEKSIAFRVDPAVQEVTRELSILEQEIIAATTIINDIDEMQSGTFELIPSAYGTGNVGWKIYGPTAGGGQSTQNLIMATKDGIGFSSNGGSSYNTAIYIDSSGNGHINGQYINAATITADRVYTGILGKRNSSGTYTGSTYFDLDNNKLSTTDSSSHYATEITGGIISQVDITQTGHPRIGGISIGEGENNGSYYEVLYYDTSGSGDGLLLGVAYQTQYTHEQKFFTLAEFTDTYIEFRTQNNMEDATNYQAALRFDRTQGSAYPAVFYPSSGGCVLGTSSNKFYQAYIEWALLDYYTGQHFDPSDRKVKKNIVDIPEDYDKFFDLLRPTVFERKDRDDGEHIGFIAQEVEEAMNKCGITKFSGVRKSPKQGKDEFKQIDFSKDLSGAKDEDIDYYLSYNEFIALCVDKIQKLEKRIKVLEANNGNPV